MVNKKLTWKEFTKQHLGLVQELNRMVFVRSAINCDIKMLKKDLKQLDKVALALFEERLKK